MQKTPFFAVKEDLFRCKKRGFVKNAFSFMEKPQTVRQIFVHFLRKKLLKFTKKCDIFITEMLRKI